MMMNYANKKNIIKYFLITDLPHKIFASFIDIVINLN